MACNDMTSATTAPPGAKPAETKVTSRNPWLWVPSLYFSEGIPYVIVMTMSVVMYKRLGISNTDIALYTSWLYLPWVIKPLWSPFIDMFRTKRFWIVAMQLLGSTVRHGHRRVVPFAIDLEIIPPEVLQRDPARFPAGLQG